MLEKDYPPCGFYVRCLMQHRPTIRLLYLLLNMVLAISTCRWSRTRVYKKRKKKRILNGHFPFWIAWHDALTRHTAQDITMKEKKQDWQWLLLTRSFSYRAIHVGSNQITLGSPLSICINEFSKVKWVYGWFLILQGPVLNDGFDLLGWPTSIYGWVCIGCPVKKEKQASYSTWKL